MMVFARFFGDSIAYFANLSREWEQGIRNASGVTPRHTDNLRHEMIVGVNVRCDGEG